MKRPSLGFLTFGAAIIIFLGWVPLSVEGSKPGSTIPGMLIDAMMVIWIVLLIHAVVWFAVTARRKPKEEAAL